MITRANKGKTLVIMQHEELRHKVLSCNEENNLKCLNKDPTYKFQKNIKDVIKTCNTIIDKDNKYKYIQIKPQAPKLNITVKLHEKNPIRAIINYRNAPSCYIVKVLVN
jgi:hypothetical protein